MYAFADCGGQGTKNRAYSCSFRCLSILTWWRGAGTEFSTWKTITSCKSYSLTEGVPGFGLMILFFSISLCNLCKIGLFWFYGVSWRSIFGNRESDGKWYRRSHYQLSLLDDLTRHHILRINSLISYLWGRQIRIICLIYRYLFKDNLNVWKEVSLYIKVNDYSLEAATWFFPRRMSILLSDESDPLRNTKTCCFGVLDSVKAMTAQHAGGIWVP